MCVANRHKRIGESVLPPREGDVWSNAIVVICSFVLPPWEGDVTTNVVTEGGIGTSPLPKPQNSHAHPPPGTVEHTSFVVFCDYGSITVKPCASLYA